jgi:hypothetical protein
MGNLIVTVLPLLATFTIALTDRFNERCRC